MIKKIALAVVLACGVMTAPALAQGNPQATVYSFSRRAACAASSTMGPSRSGSPRAEGRERGCCRAEVGLLRAPRSRALRGH